jgi:hypothetical protein
MRKFLRVAVGIVAALTAFWAVKFAVNSGPTRTAYAPPAVYTPAPAPRLKEIGGQQVDLRNFMSNEDLAFCRRGFPTGARKEVWEEYLAKCEN